MDAPVARFVAILILAAGCASAADPHLAIDAAIDAAADAAGDAARDAAPPDACIPGPEHCNGLDDDCDGHIDEDFLIGMPCDGPDADLCAEGVRACSGPDATMCTDTTGDSVELCNTLDDDCDGMADEGFGVGTACDGPDSDACAEGQIVCNAAGGTTCTDNTPDSIELCNGLDDDCRNGIDDTFPVGQACTVGLGSCARTGTEVCNAAQTGVQCNAVAGAPMAELCGNGVDEDCNGSDATCPSNDFPAGAIDISAGGLFSADLTAAHDDNWAASTPTLDCGNQGGRDVFYKFTLPAAEVVYFDTFGSTFDTVIRVFAGSCTAIGATQACADDACGVLQSQGAAALAAGTYCLVVDQFSSSATLGATTLRFRRGGRSGTGIATASGSKTGTTAGKADQSVASCQANSHQPDDAYYFLTCPNTTYSIGANTCTGTGFDSVIYLRTGTATGGDVACSDDSTGCGNGLQSRFSSASVSGANLQWLIVDGYGDGTGPADGPYTLTYTIQ